MALSGNANFNAALASVSRTPAFIVRFEDNTTTQFATGPIQADSYTTKEGYLNIPSAISQKIDFKKKVTTISGFSFTVLDKGQFVTDFIYDLNTDAESTPATKTPALNHKITLMVGFADINEADFLDIIGYVDKIQYNGVSWEFTCRDSQRLTKQRAWKAYQTTGAEAMDNSEVGYLVADGSGFSVGDYLRVDDEIMKINVIVSNLLTVTRGALETTAATHNNEAQITQVHLISGHPMDILVTDLWQTELGIAAGDIETGSITDIKSHWLPSVAFEFLISEPGGVDAKKWEEEQILTPTDTYVKIRGDGTLSVGINKVPFPDEGTTTIDEDKLIDMGLGRLDREMVNEIEAHYNYNLITGAYESKTLFVKSDSINQFGKTNTLTWKLRGVRTTALVDSAALNASSIITRAANRYFAMLGYSTPPVSGNMSFQNFLWEVGDNIGFSHTKLPDISDGTAGISSTQVVISQAKPNYQAGNIGVTFRQTGLVVKEEYAKIGSQVNDYGSATANEKLYGYIGSYDFIAPG